MNNSLNFKGTSLTKQSIHLQKSTLHVLQMITMQSLPSGWFIFFHNQSMQLSAILCHMWTFLKFFTMAHFRIGIDSASHVLKESNSGKGSTIVTDFRCR